MNSMRINFLLPQPNMSGGVKSNRLIAEALARRGHDVTMYHIVDSSTDATLAQPRKMIRHAYRRWKQRNRQRHHLEGSQVPIVSLAAKRIEPYHVRDADYVIATWWETMEWLDQWPSVKGRKAYFVRAHEVFNGPIERVRATYQTSAQKLVISTWLQRLMASEYGDSSAVLVPNGVDWSTFNSAPRDKAERPTVGMMYGREPWKGASTAFEALRIVQSEIPDVRMIAFGSKDLRREHRAPRDLEFQLRPPPRELARVYQQTDCWVLSSTTEGFGMPGLEAAASHCPLVCTQCGGPEDYVRHGQNGFLVPVDAPEEMACRVLDILSLSSVEWKVMSGASYAIARTFDWDESADRLEKALADSVRVAAA